FFGVDTGAAEKAIASMTPRQPLAYSDQLDSAAQGHSQDMANTKVQSHNGSDGSDLGTRLNRVGYTQRGNISENAYAYADSDDNAMDAFLHDWGNPQKGHLNNLLQPGASKNDSFNEVGLGIVNTGNGNFGPKVITQDFAHNTATPARLLGTVYQDKDGD